jgi:hypothetical protein
MFELQLGYSSGHHLKETSKWVTFIAIVYFIVCGILLLAFLVSASAISAAVGASMTAVGVPAGLIILIVVCALTVWIFATYHMIRFASLIRRGVDSQDQWTFNSALRSLKIYFILAAVLGIGGILYTMASFAITMFFTASLPEESPF